MDRSWETLQPDLLELILDRLAVPDYLRFSAVCRQWHRVQTEHRLRSCHTPSAVQMPWLMLPEDYRSPQSRLFYSLYEQRFYRLPIPPLGSQEHFYGTSHGWLFFLYREDDTNLLLLKNLVTGSEILLPALPRHIFDHSATLSSSPTDPDCVVLLWSFCKNYYYCRIRDLKWIASPDPTKFLPAFPAIYEGKIYMDVGESKLMELELCPIPVEKCLNMVGLPPAVVCLKFLVESDGELLLVRCITNQENDTNMFEIFKADLSRKVWARLESLGDRVMFLAYRKSFCIGAVDAACPRNKIYFTSFMDFFNQGTTPGPLWIEYDYENHHVLNGKFRSSMGNGQEDFDPGLMHWLVPSLH